ncbi:MULTISPECIES: shikimate kinase [Cyanophyceae]|uniref:shikimate kinase n=1 Tax=Cyanophyceae TaxID=3028117 RepID=UPI00168841A2|nr:shikimate kinase [Trichocoleus sp. FACHB-40]MBD2004809.1 shikimate kinase [Trichocoleus sp. FACHB-40]
MENNNRQVRESLKGINIYLVGMMGAGKTSVGKLLAQQLGYGFVDTDSVIEKAAGKSINDIFVSDGEDSFRQMESKVLQEMSAFTRLAIATGGGIILRLENWGYLQYGLVVWLDAPVELLVARLQNDTTRPLLKNADLATELENRCHQRQPLYAQADLQISISQEQTPEQIAKQIIEAIPTVLKKRPQSNNGH